MAISPRTCGLIVALAFGSALSTGASAAASARLNPMPAGVVPCDVCGLDLAKPNGLSQELRAPAPTRAHPSCTGTFRYGTTGRKSRLMRAVSHTRFPRFESVTPLQPEHQHPSYLDLIPPVGDDPNDNETSGDPTEDDDDGWNDLGVDDGDSHLAIFVWSWDWVFYLIAPEPLPVVQTPVPTSLFLALERIRC